MGDLLIRALDDALIEGLKARAVERKERVAFMQRIRAMTPTVPSGVQWPTTETMVREDRDNHDA